MPPMDLFLAFLATTAIFALIPGPAMLYATARTLAGGRASGLMASLGIHVGCYVHVLAAAAGLSAIFHAVPTLYLVVKLVGAAYLVWIGIRLFRSPPAGVANLPSVRPGSPRRAFAESIAVEVLNPKTAIFFMAFLPQFVDPAGDAPVWIQFLILGAIVNLMFSAVDILCVFAAGSVAAALKTSVRAQRLMQRAGGTVLVGLGLHIAMQRS